MSLLNYLPTSEEINLCINHEAEGAHDAVLLAVHQPSPLSYRLTSSGTKYESSEDELFEYLITTDVPSGSHVVPITGASGVGKSHMVRMLSANLHNVNEDGRYVIIRIPKSASLRRVVELILDELPGDEYASVRAEFAQAFTEELNISTAVIRFQGQLDIALSELAKDLLGQLKSNPTNSALKEQIGHARALPKFMGDPELVDYFRSEVFPKIVKRALEGQSQQDETSRVVDFHADDFLLPESVNITKAASTTHSYYLRSLQTREGEGRRAAAKLLNESKVVDRAISQLFSLHQSLGGMTLQEVILEIRQLLLRQDRELVIFVEDFKALTGIQDTLLNVLIQEGVRDGVKELATMRSVIAVTDGYLAGQDTIATRAKREWIVESHLSSPEEVFRRTKALVASYLNAARWGYRNLVQHFEVNGCVSDRQGVWIEPYIASDDARDASVLTAFGKERGIPLFPYTEQAIEQLAQVALTRNNVLVFTPRFIIDNILRNVLLPGRPAFERGNFPPPDIKAPGTSGEVSQWLTGLPVSDEVRERYRRVVAIWGNAPRTPAEIGRIPMAVFDAFTLDRPDITPIHHLPDPSPEKGSPVPLPSEPKSKPHDAYLIDELEQWAQKGERISQKVANEIRKSIARVINERIDWSAERIAKAPFSPTQISIPNAAGEGNIVPDPIRVAVDHTDPTGQLRSEMAAVVRFSLLNGGKLDYAGADDDLIWIGNLMDRLMPQALNLLRISLRQKLGTAVRLLSTNSHILGRIERHRTPKALAYFLFGAPIISQRLVDDAPVEFGDWRGLQERALEIRPELIQIVASYCGSFQGSGKTPYAMDLVRLVDCLMPEEEPTNLNTLDLNAELKAKLVTMTDVRVMPVARKVLQIGKSIRATLTTEIGDNFDKQEVLDELKALAGQLKESGYWSDHEIGVKPPAFMKMCEEFRGAAVRESLAMLASSEEGEKVQREDQLISRIARLDIYPLIVAKRFVETARKVVVVSEKRARFLASQFQGVSPQEHSNEIIYLLESLMKDLDAITAEGVSQCS
jgi:hypothetical protein